MINAYAVAQLLHLLGASVWIGGHLVIAFGYLPRLLRGDPYELKRFEEVYEKIGIPSLLLVLATGAYMGLQWAPLEQWLAFEGKARILDIKAAMALTVLLLAADVKLRIEPKAEQGKLPVLDLAAHIILVTILSIGFLVAGWLLRFT
ncbi:CopD family protein [Pyrofollis japonicus]|uniref:CopD family protein n=1 Tax=Pyrofollis japonicus TaxID=3060460 RepID=UPI00295AE4D7|nr:CopD family protein [Pyrofollis japonicus]BEP16678.1 CopD family protein [Pyrofollis japonicus]